jgi:Carboxypeptidase regulatory-like domain
MESPMYPCSQSDLIVVVKTGINSCTEHLSRLTAFSPMYTNAYFEGFLTEVDAADALPDEAARRTNSEMLRLELVGLNRDCCNLWQLLKRYISKTYTGEALALQLGSAGQGYYTKAINQNWPSTRSMLVSASQYLVKNKDKLLENNNMPPDFPTQLTNALQEYAILLTNYEGSKEDILVATQAKIVALNGSYKKLIGVLLDGQELFKNEEPIYKQFVFDEIWSRVSGPGLAGIRGQVTQEGTKLPVKDAIVSLSDFPGTALTDEQGNYLINAPSGQYTVTIIADGFISRLIEKFNIEIGTVSKLEIALTPVPAMNGEG